jgi:creatinine amidohydrolase/Fe(II)-dependent formamide hydrolase-like protein
MEGKPIIWQEITWPEIKKVANEVGIAIFPIGATEQHGLHCPAGVDFYNAYEISKRVSARTGAIVAPPMPYGSHPYFHYGFVGTIPIRATTQIEFVRDVIKGLVNSGFRKVIIMQAHGQWWTIHTAIQEIALDVDCFMAVATWWELACETIKKVCTTPFKHADEVESSVSLALYPELCDMSKAKEDYSLKSYLDKKFVRPAVHAELINAFPIEAITFVPQENTMETGAPGNPTLATAEKGEAIVSTAVNVVVDLIEYLKKNYKPGEWPKVKPVLKVDMY